MPNWKVCTDGGSPQNPGPAAYGFVIETDAGEKITRSGFLPYATNNVAEYAGVTAAAWFLLKMEKLPEKIEFWSDSELIVRQLSGQYRVNENLHRSYHEALSALTELRKRASVTVAHFKRVHNAEADELCNEVLRRRGIEIVSKKRKG
jgi:ribonuclease HI